MNIASRIEDHQINRFTPYGEVKKILDERFLRRLESRVGARIVPLGTTGNGVRDTCLENEATAQRLRPQAYHDNPSWTWEVDNHRLALVLSLWIEQNTQRRLESEDRRGALSVYVFWSGAGSKIQPVLLVTLPRTLQICIRCTKGIHILSTFPRGFITT